MNKVREFWIDVSTEDEDSVCFTAWSKCGDYRFKKIHVIEYSEVERLKSENQKLKDELDHLRVKLIEVSVDHPCYKLSKELESENQRLKDELGHLKDCESALGKLAIRHQKLKKATQVLVDALEKSMLCTSEAINGIYRGFIGNAQVDLEHSQQYKKSAIQQYREMMASEKD